MSDVTIRRADAPGDLGWVVMAHGEQYAREQGWDQTFEALVAQVVGDYGVAHDPRREGGFLAVVDGRRAGSVFLVDGGEPGLAKLRVLLVDPAARGLGVGSALLDHALDFARAAGYERVTLWTNDVLVDARRLYVSRGFRLVSEETHRSFGHDLVGQHWELALDAPTP